MTLSIDCVINIHEIPTCVITITSVPDEARGNIVFTRIAYYMYNKLKSQIYYHGMNDIHDSESLHLVI